MIGLLAAERRKLTSVRTIWALTLIGWAFAGLTASASVFGPTADQFRGEPAQIAAVIDGIGQSSLFVLVVGLLVMTTEFRHATAGRTLLVTPSRTRMLAAKLIAGVGYALMFVAGGIVVVAVVLGPTAVMHGARLQLDAEVAAAVRDTVAGLGLTALLGVAVGALVRSQVVAITVSLAWVFVLENLVAFLRPGVGRYLPFQALQGLFVPAGTEMGPIQVLDPLPALATFLAYVVVALGLSLVLLTRRDI